jgi:hypothetical protein
MLQSLEQWFSTFLSLRHTNFENMFGGTPDCQKKIKKMKIWRFCILSLTVSDLAAHLLKFYYTLVRRGTPAEKHCSRKMLTLIMIADDAIV